MTHRDVIEPIRPEGVNRTAIDFTPMYATHNAFRRDLERLREASAAGKSDNPQVRAGWENVKTQLRLHHSVEDTHLWPPLRREVKERARAIALIAEMEAEHAHLDPLLTAVDEALANRATNLAERAKELSAAVGEHCRHEEGSALPLIQAFLKPADWRGFTVQMRRRQGFKGAAVYIPWILDETPLAEQRQFMATLPAPARLINRLFWEPRYRKRNLWKF